MRRILFGLISFSAIIFCSSTVKTNVGKKLDEKLITCDSSQGVDFVKKYFIEILEDSSYCSWSYNYLGKTEKLKLFHIRYEIGDNCKVGGILVVVDTNNNKIGTYYTDIFEGFSFSEGWLFFQIDRVAKFSYEVPKAIYVGGLQIEFEPGQ